MAKQLRSFDGNIEQVKPPRFAPDRKVWVMMVKENGTWTAVVSRDEERIKAHYGLLKSKRLAQSRVTIQKLGIRELLKKPRRWCRRRCCKADRQLAGQTQIQKTIHTIPNKHTRRRFIKTPAKLQNPDGSHPAGNHSVEVLRPLGFWQIVRIVGCAVFHGNTLLNEVTILRATR